MYRGILTPLSAGVILVAFAALPPILPGSTTLGVSGSAQAQKLPTTDATNLNSSRSNNYRMGGGGGGKSNKRGKTKQSNTPDGPAGIAVSDPGSEGSKPSKPKTK